MNTSKQPPTQNGALMRSFLSVLNHEFMFSRLDWSHRSLPAILGWIALLGLGALLFWDLNPAFFPARAHDVLGAFPLAFIAAAYLAYRAVRRPAQSDLGKAVLLAAAFLLWAANQLWPDFRDATLFNDLAIALFVLDVFLVIVGWPSSSPDISFAETCESRSRDRSE
jgi:hypothetical protein